jgi:glycerol-3-phosphate dehydrogenase
VRKLYDHDRAYIFQNADGRIIFAIPYETDFTLIGTTDRDWTGDPADVAITDGEIDYLLAAASEYFTTPIGRDQIVWTYSGVRPLYDDGASKAQEATRDYVLKVDGGNGAARMVNVFGGKITTYRRLAESVMEKIEEALGKRAARWTAGATLPGGDFPVTGFERLVADLSAAHPGVSAPLVRRLARAYGTRARDILGTARSDGDLGRDFGAGLREAEVRYLVANEWARTAHDILWRRSKLGLRLGKAEAAALDDHLAGLTGENAAAQ